MAEDTPRGGLRRVRPRVRAAASEQGLADYWTFYADADRTRLAFLVRHPLRSIGALIAMTRLPSRTAAPSGGAEGAAIRESLEEPGLLGVPFRWSGAAVLEIPADPDEYLVGRSRQTLRRKIRAAEKQGVTCREVRDAVDRAALLDLANAAEQSHRDETYLVARPDNQDLLDHDLWLAAYDAHDEPLLLTVVPVDGAWSTLRYFRTLGWTPAHSDSRYLATAALVHALSARGVRHLLDIVPPGALPNGLRHFQRMIGFRYVRVRLRRAPA